MRRSPSIRVQVLPADPATSNPALGGLEQFAIVSSTDIVKARDRGYQLKAIHVIVPEPAIVFMAKESSGICEVRDFEGRRVAYRADYEEADVLKVLLKDAGLSTNDVESMELDASGRELIDDKAEIVAGHLGVEPIMYQTQQVYVRLFKAEFRGEPLFADTLATDEQLIRTLPQVARAAAKSASAGWAFVSTHRNCGVESTLCAQRNYSRENMVLQRKVLNAMIGLTGNASEDRDAEEFEFGMTDEHWEPVIEAMHEVGVISKKPNPSELYWR